MWTCTCVYTMWQTPPWSHIDKTPAWVAWMVDARTTCMEPGAPWENSYIESFNGGMMDGLSGRRSFAVIEEWQTYKLIRPHRSLGYRPPATRLPTLSLSLSV